MDRWLGTVLAGMIATACAQRAPIGVPNAARGIVLRGPVTPVCRVDTPCDAPFSALFHVWSGSTEVARFITDSTGRFALDVPDGGYVIVPDSSAPLLNGPAQRRAVSLVAGRLIPDTLSFDTGIR